MLRSLISCTSLILYLSLGSATAHDEDFHADHRRDREIHNSAPPGAVSLGRRLFFDPGLSGSGETACATCHNPKYGYASPERRSIFDSGRAGPRNAPSLLTAASFPQLMWDGRFGSLEEQVSGPLSPDGEMGNGIGSAARHLAENPDYRQHFQAVFGEPPTASTIFVALAAFERSLVPGWSRFDDFFLAGERKALSAPEKHGFELFTGKARCILCHKLPDPGEGEVPLFTDFGFHNIGIGFGHGHFGDRGRGAITRRRIDMGAYRTPSLRNVAITPPYMHDGSLDSLPAVIEFYNGGGQPNPYQSHLIRPLGLSEHEKRALVRFLESLTAKDLTPGTKVSQFEGQPPGE